MENLKDLLRNATYVIARNGNIYCIRKSETTKMILLVECNPYRMRAIDINNYDNELKCIISKSKNIKLANPDEDIMIIASAEKEPIWNRPNENKWFSNFSAKGGKNNQLIMDKDNIVDGKAFLIYTNGKEMQICKCCSRVAAEKLMKNKVAQVENRKDYTKLVIRVNKMDASVKTNEKIHLWKIFSINEHYQEDPVLPLQNCIGTEERGFVAFTNGKEITIAKYDSIQAAKEETHYFAKNTKAYYTENEYNYCEYVENENHIRLEVDGNLFMWQICRIGDN